MKGRRLVELVLVVGLVELAGEAEHGVGIDQSGRDHGGFDDATDAGRDGGVGGTDAHDFAIRDHDDGILDRRSCHGVQGVGAHEQGLPREAQDRAGEEREEKRADKRDHGERAQWLCAKSICVV